MQITPIAPLAHLVRHFLILESPGNEKTLHYGVPLHPFPKSFAYGQVTRPHSIVSTGKLATFIVVLRPHALSYLTGLPAYTFTDTAIALQDIWGPKATLLEKQMINASDHRTRIEHIQAFLLQKITHLPSGNELIEHSLQQLEEQENLNIEQLVRQLSIGRRTLERTFRTAIGVSPKQFAGIIRTQHFLKALSQTRTENITRLAYEFGYYDQSHLIRDFKTKTGITPGKYFAAKDTLALNFIQFPG
jgi:AraC-like DNA-binding protein